MIIEVLETDRLTLHPLAVTDAVDMVDVLADESLYEFIGGEPPTLDGLRTRYEYQIAGPSDPDETWWNWIIRDADDRAMGFVQADVTGEIAEIAWVVGVADQGAGIAAEAAKALIGWLTRNQMSRIEAHIHPDHGASMGVARNIGMTNTGVVDDEGEMVWALTNT